MRKLSLLALFTFVLTLAPLVAVAQVNSTDEVIHQDIVVQPSKASVLVKPTFALTV